MTKILNYAIILKDLKGGDAVLYRLEVRGSLVLVIVDDVPVFHTFSMEDGLTRFVMMQDSGLLDPKTFEDLVVLLRSSDLPKFNDHALEENVIRCTVLNRLLESQRRNE